MTNQTIIILGLSGSGKGTQVSLLKKHLLQHTDSRVVHIEMGALYREFIAKDYYSSTLSRGITDAGKLNPDFLSTWFLAQACIENIEGGEHLIIDGVPRGVLVAQSLDSGLNFYKRGTPRHVVHLVVSEEWARVRLKERDRVDDSLDSKIDNKFAFFKEHVLPTIEQYKKMENYKVHTINGEQSVEKVFSDMLSQLAL